MVEFNNIILDEQTINKLFPFHFILDKSLKIVRFGKSLNKLYNLKKDSLFQDEFEIKRPFSIELTFTSFCEYQEQIFILKSYKNSNLNLRGQFINIDNSFLLFIGSPWVVSIEDLEQSRLNIADFALHDTTLDLIQVIKTKDVIQTDLNLLIQRLNENAKRLNDSNKIADNKTEFLKTLIENLRSAILFENENGDIQYLNSGFCNLIGICTGVEELIGLNHREFIKSISYFFINENEFITSTELLIKNKVPKRNQEIEVVGDKYFERDYIPIFNDDIFIGNLWVYRDITESKQKNTQLALYKRLFDNSSDAIQISDEQGFLVYINNTASERLGIPIENCELHNVKEFELIFQEEGAWEKHINELQNVKNITLIGKNKNLSTGKEFPVEVSVALIFAYGKKYVIADSRDISERVLMENELKKQKQIAEDLSETKDKFMANVSHELRNPLNILIGITNLFDRSNLNKEQNKYLDLLSHSSNNLLFLVNDILEFNKLKEHTIVLRENVFNLYKSISELIDSYEYIAKNKQLNLIFNYAENKDIALIGDEYRLKQVLSNLINNAITYTNSGIVGVNIKLNKNSEKNISLIIEVSDTGIGICKDELPFIFDRYNRSSSVQNKYPGTGLGLYIVEKIITLQGGNIYVESELGKGTIFKVNLPFILAENKSIKNNTNSDNNYNDLIGKKVLLVEDNKVNQLITLDYLSSFKVNLDIADNGQIALNKLKKSTYDLILLDLQMPVLNGLETIQAIRTETLYNHNNTPVVALTANVSFGNELINKGFDNQLTKPFNKTQLAEVILNCLNNKHTHLNLIYLNEYTQSNIDLSKSILIEFSESIPDFFSKIEKCIANNNVSELASLIHKLKSSIGYLGANKLYAIADFIESKIKNKTFDINEQIFIIFVNECRLLVAEIKEELKLY